LTQSNQITAGENAALTATTGTLEQNGTIVAGGSANLTAAVGMLDQTGLVTAGGAATFVAGGDLMQTGGVHANGGTASFTATNDLTQTGLVTAGNSATLTALDGNLAQSGSIAAGASAILTARLGNISDGGIVTAPNIQVAAPNGMITLTGEFAGVQPDPTLKPLLKLAKGTFPSDPAIGAWIIGQNIVVTPSVIVSGAGGGLSELVVKLTNPQGLVTFGNFNNQSTELYLDLGLARAAGQIAVNALQVQYARPGTTQLINLQGTVDGFSGSTAASASFIQPLENSNYQINGCTIGSVNCFQFSTLSIPTINPLKDLEVSTPDQTDEILIILPDVGERDY
jgi:hypothetical protein